VLDRLVLTSIASVWAVHEAHHPDADHDHEAGGEAKGRRGARGNRSGTRGHARLVRYSSPLAAASLPRAINKETELVAVSRLRTALLTVFGVGIDLVRAFAWC
jgi:putative ABC transport system permease protein